MAAGAKTGTGQSLAALEARLLGLLGGGALAVEAALARLALGGSAKPTFGRAKAGGTFEIAEARLFEGGVTITLAGAEASPGL